MVKDNKKHEGSASGGVGASSRGRSEGGSSDGARSANARETPSYSANTDYGTLIKQGIASGGTINEIESLLNSRYDKATGTEGLGQYANDDIQKRGWDYVNLMRSLSSSSSTGTPGVPSTGGFTYENAPQYASKYQDQIDQLTQQLLGSNYNDWAQGSDYAALEGRYTKNGQRAMQDTLGQVSARTGGLASSYAGAASQQSYNSYMSQLEEAAREMYNAERSRQQQDINLLMALEQGDYAKYQGLLGQYNTDRGFDYGAYSDDRNFNYGMGRDMVNDQRWGLEWGRQGEQDAYNRAFAEDERDYNRGFAEDERDYARRMDELGLYWDAAQQKWQYFGDPSGFGSDALNPYFGDTGAMMGAMGGAGGGSSGGKKKKSSSGGDKTQDAKIDAASVLGLGYGPISMDSLTQMEDRGEVESYEQDGWIKFKNTNNGTKITKDKMNPFSLIR